MTFRYRGVELPQRYMAQLDNLAKTGTMASPYLMAVLENNLYGAINIAMSQDGAEYDVLPVVIAYCYNELPAGCWGTPQKVSDWGKKFLEAA